MIFTKEFENNLKKIIIGIILFNFVSAIIIFNLGYHLAKYEQLKNQQKIIEKK